MGPHSEAPVVVVGNGPVGMRVVQELLERTHAAPLVIFGEEPHVPYNRVRLSSWLAGELKWEGLLQPLNVEQARQVDERIGYRVARIDPVEQVVVDNRGGVLHYSKLVLATGSSAFVPNIPGVQLHGVFTFRNLNDTTALLARRARSHHTVVLGGGLLGLEAARGMQRLGTQVTIVDHADRLLVSQLDEHGSAYLQYELGRLGIGVLLRSGVERIVGHERVKGIVLRDGTAIACDTVVLATGIRPNVQLAKEARLAFRKGILVDDAMHTSDPDIYAVGECAEHRERIYGLVAPGLEQASVAAANISGSTGHYQGSIVASRLKVVGVPVFSMGPMGVHASRNYGQTYSYNDAEKGVYRKILVHRHRLEGAIAVGEWHEVSRLQSHIGQRGWIMPWQVLRFLRSGCLWPEEEARGAASWPSAAIVCQCNGVICGQVDDAVNAGACSVAAVGEMTGAGTVCGSCRPLIQEFLGGGRTEAVRWWWLLLSLGGAGFLGAMLAWLLPPIPYADSVQRDSGLDQLWRNGLIKQVSGFTVLGLFAVGLLVSLRKRWPRFSTLGSYDAWRLLHIVLGVLALLALVAHTGMRTGHGLNFLLASSFLAMLAVGGISSLIVGLGHHIGGSLARRWQRQSGWLHILLFWPAPVLLGWHIFKTYWY